MIALMRAHYEQMLADCQKRVPIEACGLVAGANGKSTAVFALENVLNSPVRYRIDPAEQLQVFNGIDESGWELLAIYHSHPAGPPYPSPTDIAEAGYPDTAYLIWTIQGGGWSCRAFMIWDDRVSEVELKILENSIS